MKLHNTIRPELISPIVIFPFKQVCTNIMHQIHQVTKFCMMVPTICGSPALNLVQITRLAPGILEKL